MAPTQSNPSSDTRGLAPAQKRKGRSNPIFALYVPADCVEPLHRLIAAMAVAPAARDEQAMQPRRLQKGANRQFIERVLSRVATLKAEHLAAMPISGRARGMKTQRIAFSVGQNALDAASAQANALGVSLQDAARAIVLSLVRKAQPQAAAGVDAFLRAHTRLARDGVASELARKLVRCEPGLRAQFDRACQGLGIQPKAAYALAIQHGLDQSAEAASDAWAPTAGGIRNDSIPNSGPHCWNVYATQSAFDAAQAAANRQGLSCGQWLRAAMNNWTLSATTAQPAKAAPNTDRAANDAKPTASAVKGVSFRAAPPATPRAPTPTPTPSAAVEPITAPTRARAGGGRFMEELPAEEAWGEPGRWAGSTQWGR